MANRTPRRAPDSRVRPLILDCMRIHPGGYLHVRTNIFIPTEQYWRLTAEWSNARRNLHVAD